MKPFEWNWVSNTMWLEKCIEHLWLLKEWGWIQWMFICIWILVSMNRIGKNSNKLSRHFFVFQKWACTSTLETYMWRLNHCLLRAHTFAKQVYFVGTRFICGVWISSSNQSILVFSQFLLFSSHFYICDSYYNKIRIYKRYFSLLSIRQLFLFLR